MVRGVDIIVWSLLSAVPAGAQESPAAAPLQSVELERTGTTKLCLRWNDVTGYAPVTETRFLFQTKDRYYVNDVMGECKGALREDAKINIVLQGATVCRNDRIDVQTKGLPYVGSHCTLSAFHELRPVAPPTPQ